MNSVKYLSYLTLQFIFIFFIATAWLSHFSPTEIQLKMQLQAPDLDRTQIFWKFHDYETYTESNSLFFSVKKGENILRTRIPERIKSIRIDPLSGNGRIHFDSLCIQYLKIPIYCRTQDSEFLSWISIYQLKADSASHKTLYFEALSTDPQIEYIVPSSVLKFVQTLKYAVGLFLSLTLCFIFGLLTSSRLKNILRRHKWAGVVIFIPILSIPLGSYFLWKKTQAPIVYDNLVFSNGTAPAFIDHLLDRAGHPLTDKPGNFALAMDPFTIFRNYPNQNVFGLTTDKNGFRGSDVIADRPVGLILGGSTAFGWRLTNNNDSIDTLLAKKMNTHFINMATVHFSVGQELAMLTHYGLNYKPKWVINISGWNDFNNYLQGRQQYGLGYGFTFTEIQDRLQRLYLSDVRKNLKPPLNNGLPLIKNLSIKDLADSYFSFIEKMQRISQAYGAEFILVLQPDLRFKKNKTDSEKQALEEWVKESQQNTDEFIKNYKAYTAQIEGLCQKNKITCINLSNARIFIEGDKKYFNDIAHLSLEGNQTVVQILLDKLKKGAL